MPQGSRIVLLFALAVTGCQSAEKRTANPLLPLRPVVNSPAGDSQTKSATPTPTGTPVGRTGINTPVIPNENVQRPIAQSASPQPGVVPPMAVPTRPGTSYPAPAPVQPGNDLSPMPPPGITGGLTTPPTAEGGVGDLKMPTMIDRK